ncbi:MAG: hypothetical protein JXA49_02020 [Actinobacteria bacterium]|nr:hypothetical protein [Actinomycetota bacterium]
MKILHVFKRSRKKTDGHGKSDGYFLEARFGEWGYYLLGIVMEVSMVAAFSLAALLVMIIVKAVVT